MSVSEVLRGVGYCMGGHLERRRREREREGGGSVCAECKLKKSLGEKTAEGEAIDEHLNSIFLFRTVGSVRLYFGTHFCQF